MLENLRRGIGEWFNRIFPKYPTIIWFPSEEIRMMAEDRKRLEAIKDIPGTVRGVIETEVPEGILITDYNLRDKLGHPTTRIIPKEQS